MLALSWLEVFTWEAIFTKARQIYSAVIRSEIAFEASVWHQREKEKELSDKERRLETLQNQTLHHVAKTFKKDERQNNYQDAKNHKFRSKSHLFDWMHQEYSEIIYI